MNFDWPKRIVFVRHAESEGNIMSSRDGEFLVGKANHAFALTKRGEQQARTTGAWLNARYTFDSFYCSTFSRTLDTLVCMFPSANPSIDSRLNELWRGIWHTMPTAIIVQEYPYEEGIREREGLFHYSAPGGQSGSDFELKIYSFLQQLRMDCSGQSVLVVTHGYWLLHLWRILQNKSVLEYEQRYINDKYRNCATCIYEVFENKLKLVLDGGVAYDDYKLNR